MWIESQWQATGKNAGDQVVLGRAVLSKELADSGKPKFRYALWRVWDTARPLVMFIMLNPSTADGLIDDRTIESCQRLVEHWKDFGGFCVGNLFGIRTPNPKKLVAESGDKVGPANDDWLGKLKGEAHKVVAAWGNHARRRQLRGRKVEVCGMFPEMWCLGITKEGEPRHPLYLPRNTGLERYAPD